MSMWQFAAAVDGWNRAQGGEEPISAPSTEEFYDMVARLG